MRFALAALAFAACALAADGDGMTLLHWAVYRDDLHAVRALLAAGEDVNAATRDGAITPLSLASTSGDAALIELLLEAGAGVNTATADGATPLMLAAASGCVDAVRLLLAHGAAVNTVETAHGQTALMFAAAKNRAAVIEVLLKNGTGFAATTRVQKLERPRVDEDGNPLPAAPDGGPGRGGGGRGGGGRGAGGRGGGLGGQARGASASVMGGMTALLFAAREGNIDAAKALLAGSADINQASPSDKTTPLVIAITNGHYDIAKLLLARRRSESRHHRRSNAALRRGRHRMGGGRLGTEPDHLPGKNHVPRSDEGAARPWRESQCGADQTAVVPAHSAQSGVGGQAWRHGLLARRAIERRRRHAIAEGAWRRSESCHRRRRDAADRRRRLGLGRQRHTQCSRFVAGGCEVLRRARCGRERQDNYNYTALHGAAYRGDNEVVRFLVEKGARLDGRSKRGQTVTDMANGPMVNAHLPMDHPDTIALLENLGAPPPEVPVAGAPKEGRGGRAPAK
jgi:ankyrin repeat protein